MRRRKVARELCFDIHRRYSGSSRSGSDKRSVFAAGNFVSSSVSWIVTEVDGKTAGSLGLKARGAESGEPISKAPPSSECCRWMFCANSERLREYPRFRPSDGDFRIPAGFCAEGKVSFETGSSCMALGTSTEKRTLEVSLGVFAGVTCSRSRSGRRPAGPCCRASDEPGLSLSLFTPPALSDRSIAMAAVSRNRGARRRVFN